MVERQTEKKVKVLHTDSGVEFCSYAFKSFCRQEDIVRHHTIPYTPQQNGVVEKMNRTIASKARCMLFNASRIDIFGLKHLPQHACYLIN
jgi:transposase InsO family protein